MEIINIVIGVVLFGISFAAFIGKGGWLTAGFNTSDDEEKAKYDMKKINIVVGIVFLVLGICEILMGVFPIRGVVIPCFIIIALIIIAMLYVINVKCKYKDE